MSLEFPLQLFDKPARRRGMAEISLSRCCLVSLFVCSLVAPMAWPQTDRGAITGTVTDSTGAVVPGVEVVAMNAATNVKYTTTSTGTGTYRVPSLPPGNYNVNCSKAGFKQAAIESVRVAVGTTVDVDVVLEVGAASQTVTVEGSAEHLQTTAEITTDVTPKEFETWPILLDSQQRQ